MRRWDVEELWGVIMLIVFSTGGYVPILMTGSNDAGGRFQYDTAAANPWSRAMIGVMWLGTLLPVGRILPRLMRSAYALRPLVPYILLAIASIAWSQDPLVSVRKISSFLLSCVFAFYFAARFPVQRQLKLVYAATSMIALASVLFVLAAPKYALDHTGHEGAWQGICAQKNSFAMIMVIGLAAAVVYVPVSTMQRVMKVFMMALFAGCILMANSSGALVFVAVVWLSLPVLRYLASYERRTRALILTILFLAGIVSVVCLVEYLPLILKLLNRDPTLTGRTDIWKAVLGSIFKHPLLGYGYGAFWLGLKGESANVVLAVKWAIPNAHNGFLDIWLSLGGIGLAFFGYALITACRRIWQIMLSHDLKPSLWMISVVILAITFNLDESDLISAPSVMWILLASAFCSLEVYARTHRSAIRYATGREPVSFANPILPAAV